MLKITTCSLLTGLFLVGPTSTTLAGGSESCRELGAQLAAEQAAQDAEEALQDQPEIVVCPAPPQAPFCPGGLEPPVVEVLHPHDPEPPVDPAPQPAADAPLIQVALLLDTSNSMDGLITQAKAQLWTIVNRFAKARQNGEPPRFQIALFEYGNTSLPAEEGYLRQVVGFTDDLDAVSAALFALTTNGGDEYCGQVIGEALHRLPWSVEANDFKAIYIAGNEPFTQGATDYKTSCEEASARGILINTIHCGDAQEGIDGKWLHGAQIAGGSYLTINQDRALVHIESPQDAQIAQLNEQLNGTYLPYGEAGAANIVRQEAVDAANAALSADAAAQRAEAKAGELYANGAWDLVDASTQEGFDLAEIPNEALPEAMRGMTLEEKQAHIAAMAEQRAALQQQIQTFAARRAQHVAAERERLAEEEGDDLGTVFLRSVDEQLEESGFETQADAENEVEDDEE